MDRNIQRTCLMLVQNMSLSARRAWIEIDDYKNLKLVLLVALRKESVDRNSFVRPVFAIGFWSLSARRAWIEISKRMYHKA